MRYIAILFCFFPFFLNSQPEYDAKRDYVWIMGYAYYHPDTVDHIFLDFRNDTFKLSKEATHYGHNLYQTNASICDTAGNFLFYSNGCIIADSNYMYFDGVDTINQGPRWENYCFRSAFPGSRPTFGYVIVNGCWVIPVAQDKYKIFYTDIIQNIGHTSGIRFATVKQIPPNGVLKGYSVDTYLYEGDLQPEVRGVVRHANGRDWWMVNEAYEDKRYYISYVDSSDIVHPTKEQYFEELPPRDFHGGSQGVFSPDGSVYATIGAYNHCQVFDFDRCNGELLNPITISLPLPYDSIGFITGIAISPNSRYMYLMLRRSIWQYDLYAPDIQATATRVAAYDGFTTGNNLSLSFYQSQIGPDGKIYVFNAAGRSTFHVIESPDSAGVACNVIQHKYLLTGMGAVEAPPRFPNFRLGSIVGSPCDTIDWTSTTRPVIQPIAKMNIRPNPASDYFVADIGLTDYSADMNLSIEVVDAMGRVVRRGYVPPYASLRRVEVGDLSAGLYFVRLKSRERVLVIEKLVVQK